MASLHNFHPVREKPPQAAEASPKGEAFSNGAGTLNAGFTLLEVMVVMGLIAIVGSVGLYFGLDAFRGYSFHSDRDLLVVALQHARAQAVSNICLNDPTSPCTDGRPHGVHVGAGTYALFQGGSYATRDTTIDVTIEMSPNTVVGGVSEIVFKQLSGDVSTPGDITLSEGTGRTSVISIGSEGQIIWIN